MLSEENAMEILEAYDLTSSFRSAAALCGVDHHTVRRYVAARTAGLDPTVTFGRCTERPAHRVGGAGQLGLQPRHLGESSQVRQRDVPIGWSVNFPPPSAAPRPTLVATIGGQGNLAPWT